MDARTPDSLLAADRTDTDRWLVVAAVCTAGLMMPLSFTGPAIATPAIAHDLGGSTAALGWIVNGFILAFGSFVMAAGTLADRYGRKRIFSIGVGGFALVSMVLGLAPSVLALDLLRVLQGICAGLAMAGGAAAMAQEVSGPARTRAFSLLGTSFGVGLAFGPLWCGFLIEQFGWRAIFLTGTLIALPVLLFGVPRMRETRDPDAVGLDWPGTICFTAMLAALTFGIVEAPLRGWGDPVVLGLLALSALLLALFIQVEHRVRRPMLDLSLFLLPRFVGAQLLPIATALCFVVLLIFLPIRFVGIEQHGELQAGLLMVALSVPMLVVPLGGALLTRWISSATLSAAGLLIAAAGLLWLAQIPLGAPALSLAGPMLLIGVGTGLPWGLMDDLAVSAVPTERAGMATGIFSTMRVAGEAVILAIVGAVLSLQTRSALTGLSVGDASADVANRLVAGDLTQAAGLVPALDPLLLRDAYGAAFQDVLLALAAGTVIAALLAALLLRQRPVRSSAR